MPKPTSDCRATERKHPWPMVRLGDVCETISTRGHQIKQSEIRESGKYPVVSQSEHDVEGWTDEDIAITQVPLVLFGDHTCVVKKIEFPFVVGADGTKLLKSKSHDNTFLFYALQRAVASLVDGKYRRHYSDLVEIEIPLPSLSVQREIVARLERELAAVEKMKKGFETLAETAKAEFKAELKEVFEELEHRGTETQRLGDVCELISDCPHTTAKDEGAGIPLIRTPNIGFTRLMLAGVHRVSEDVYKQRTKRAVPMPGDLIFAREAPAGNVAVIQEGEKVCLGQRTVLLRLKKGCSPDYIAYGVLQPESQKTLVQKSTGSTVAHVNVCDIKTFLVPVPSLDDQREVVVRLDAAKARAEKLGAKAREGVAVCETMRKAILKEAFDPGR